MATNDRNSPALTTWKEIAEYLGISQRTAQNWAKEKGLPVKHLPGPRGRVLADPLELENWKKTAVLIHENGRTAWYASVRFLRSYALVLTALALIALAISARSYLAAGKPGPPAGYHFDYKTFVATDSAGNIVWKAPLPEPVYAPHYVPEPTARPPVWFGDLNGDGRTETLLLYDPINRHEAGCTLICFSDKGRELWHFATNGTVSDLERTFSPPFLIANFMVADPDKDGRNEILVTSHHFSDYPNQFVILDHDGNVTGEYWHSGFLGLIDTMDLDQDGVDEILLADVNNGYKSATLVVLDPRKVAGASSQPAGDVHQLQGFMRGSEKAVVLFPRSCINQKIDDYDVTGLMSVHGGTIRIETVEKKDDLGCRITYVLDGNLTVIDIQASDRFRAVHRELALSGTLDHSFSDQELQELKKGVRVIRNASVK